jgi:hypothetical protein
LMDQVPWLPWSRPVSDGPGFLVKHSRRSRRESREDESLALGFCEHKDLIPDRIDGDGTLPIMAEGAKTCGAVFSCLPDGETSRRWLYPPRRPQGMWSFFERM